MNKIIAPDRSYSPRAVIKGGPQVSRSRASAICQIFHRLVDRAFYEHARGKGSDERGACPDVHGPSGLRAPGRLRNRSASGKAAAI
jgi:hypothetical protein